MPSSLASLLRRALALVEQTPFCAGALRESLGHSVVAVQVGHERCWLRGCVDHIEVLSAAPDALLEPPMLVRTTGPALLDVLDGRVELLAALRSNALRVRATTGAAARLFDAMKHFVEGCARSDEGPELLLELRHSFRRRDA